MRRPPAGGLIRACRGQRLQDDERDQHGTTRPKPRGDARGTAETAADRRRHGPSLAVLPKAGENLVIVGDGDPFAATSHLAQEPAAITYVLAPDGRGGFAVLGAIAAEEDRRLTRRRLQIAQAAGDPS